MATLGKRFSGLLMLVVAGSGWAEESWLEVEVRAQEARWAAQQDKTPELRPTNARPMPPVLKGGRRVDFPALAAQGVRGAPQDPGNPPSAPAFSRPAQRDRLNAVSPLILASAQQHRVDPLLVRAVILTESAGWQRARSPKGAIGLMQLMPATARRFGVNPYDPQQNIHGGTQYLRWLLDYFDGDVRLALAGYNAGEGAVNKYGGIPPFRETRNYVTRVLGFHQALRASTNSLAKE